MATQQPQPLRNVQQVRMSVPEIAGQEIELEDKIYLRTTLNRMNDLINSNITLGEQVCAAKRWTMIAVVFSTVVSLFTLLMVWALRHHVAS